MIDHAAPGTLFDTVLVANRGEIAVRVIRTLRRLGIRSVAVYSDADAGAPHVAAADMAVRLGPAPAVDSYLRGDLIVAAARRTGAQAVHPGYGFLSENTAFAQACADAGLTFIGPPVAAIAAMGDKIRAKQTVVAAGVPVVPGSSGLGLTDAELAIDAERVGYPVLLKPSAGGGGKGMREVHDPADLVDAIAGARREARSSFGDDTLLVERLVTTPRHLEIQVLADTHGGVVHLGERECSLQRRHQKVIEEAPSPLLTPAQRSAMGQAACAAARACGYAGAGTVEFIVGGDRPDEFFFLEMNTRLQVEHPVTELVTGLDLVEWQVRVAAGQSLPFAQDDITLTGHAVEARLYAEDPATGFLPTGGPVLAWEPPADARVDAGIVTGSVVGSDYDPMLAKIIAHGDTRAAALDRLAHALRSTVLLGLPTNLAFLHDLVTDPDVRAGRLDTGLIARRLDDRPAVTAAPPGEVLAAVAAVHLLAAEPASPVIDPFDLPGGWRLGPPAWTPIAVQVDGAPPVTLRIRGRAAAGEYAVPGADGARPAVAITAAATGGQGGTRVRVQSDGLTTEWAVAHDPDGTLWVGRDGHTWAVRLRDPAAPDTGGEETVGGPVRSPMPGTVTVVAVTEGQTVHAGQTLVVIEAMKMEHVLSATTDGVVSGLRARVGGTVGRDEVLLSVGPDDDAPTA
ncbi:biotin/lipoyl-binding protein [Nakamurella flava]|uniref:Biotin-dependent 3-methylcrotonyl-coenzyme A carboxylase alpha1 subunit n=1 Tax=Nakamurella flava TaxID=2576308 RepID=A0A4U6Q952_9ACTN|nr:biotin carboxylase N-terminal domain-containing protein [Nakamurella flava]TKV56413.1 biotin/lipoyl-binding protein [Nakamurella flava]